MLKKLQQRLIICLGLMLLTGCASIMVSLAGIGAGAGVNHQINGIVSRTFSEPLPRTKEAVLLALEKMMIRIHDIEKNQAGESIAATTGITTTNSSERQVRIEMEVLSANVTRISVVVRVNVLMVDAATAQEIVEQTNKALNKT